MRLGLGVHRAQIRIALLPLVTQYPRPSHALNPATRVAVGCWLRISSTLRQL